MEKQSGCSWQIIFTPQPEENPLLDSFTENFFQVCACNYTEDGKVEYVGYSPSPIDEAAMQEAARTQGLKLPAWRCEFIPAANWLTKNVIRFPPLETEDFYIYGTHEDTPPATSKNVLRIYAATAFGSGQHQTTRSCLELLSLLYHQGFVAASLLDMGCGSGILALSALKLWQNVAATAADIDEEAVIVTLQNADDNGLSHRITAAAGDGYANDKVLQNAPYDLIFSNILARPLIEMAPRLSAVLKTGGYAVLSGFTADQTDWVVSAHQVCGLTPVTVVCRENWRAVLMKKENNPSGENK